MDEEIKIDLARNASHSDAGWELEELKKKSEEYLNGWKRERADFMNYKKDEMERIGSLIKYANEEIILNILPILDNLYLAEAGLSQKENAGAGLSQKWVEGFLQIKKQLEDFLKKEGIEAVKTVGEQFDPNTMEVVEEIGSDEESGTVVEESQKGYKMYEKLIRPAKVKVSK
ncbi:MAG: nucleotide exchange factor GrpE [Candidatus Staskawiczbacteria bacterium]|nr:nucleotide exchange factor GrpE [Candidatus Staskawiczbacteria bacterium]